MTTKKQLYLTYPDSKVYGANIGPPGGLEDINYYGIDLNKNTLVFYGTKFQLPLLFQ